MMVKQKMMMNSDGIREYGSFRDPAGRVYWVGDSVYREVNSLYFEQYDKLMESGLYDELVKFHALIPHEEVYRDEKYITIRPQVIPFISYPYEWSFGELKDAALVTLKIHRRAMKHGMILKDATAYNIQFVNGYATLIDTLSFDNYTDGDAWGAYGQFCRHFLAPLLLMAYKDFTLNRLLMLFIDGIPLDLATSLLSGKGGMFARQHIIWHSRSVQRHNSDGKNKNKDSVKRISITKKQHLALIDSLIRGVESLKFPHKDTEWGTYYSNTNYDDSSIRSKKEILNRYLDKIQPGTVWDMGANDGTFSSIAVSKGAYTVAFDLDPVAVESNYDQVRINHSTMLPLVLDLTNPSPSIGFANRERRSISNRQRPDCLLALAIIHHLAISNNLPFDMIAEWFSSLSDCLIIEFVPKEDSQVKLLLATRRDIFPDYSVEGFEASFLNYYSIVEKEHIQGSKRILYHMKKRN